MRLANDEGVENNYNFNHFVYPTAKQFIIFLFTMENSHFFFDVLLENEIKIDFLTHINDGGLSLGGSKIKMDFIYYYIEMLGLKNMIIDLTLDYKQQRLNDWPFHHYFNPKARRQHFIRYYPEINLNNWSKSEIFFPYSTGIYIKRKLETGHHY